MKAALILVRLAASVVLGWPLTFAPVLVTATFGLNAWGYAHLGIPLFLYTFAVWLVYALLGSITPFKKRPERLL
jgi:hypothetical protein